MRAKFVGFERHNKNPLVSLGVGNAFAISKITSDDLTVLNYFTDIEGSPLVKERGEEYISDDEELEIAYKRALEVERILHPYAYLFGDHFEGDMKKEMKAYIKSYLKNPKFNFVYDYSDFDEEFRVFFCEIELPSAMKIKY